MDRFFGNAYRGDPGVPHADPDRFVTIWIGSFAFSAITWFHPYMWQLSNQFKYSFIHFIFLEFYMALFLALFSYLLYKSRVSFFISFAKILYIWHDRAMLFEQYHWKKALKKRQPYKFKWNEYMDKDLRDSYYFNWPVYFP
ncbi:hypothetical protein Scep_016453 [Stephania cephalantha]|uniref:Uncharacterized protein n=1 Tax=Stephania cephalantha TaxID=152367 RepID=A0AAP0NUN4_9MAGN